MLFFFISLNGYAQLKSLQFGQLDSLQLEFRKPVVVILHTEWCQYCAAMINAAKTNPKIYDKLNNDFYFVMLDAEDKRDIRFNNRVYHYKPNGLSNGFNELAVDLTKDRGGLVFPNLIFLDNRNNVFYNYPGYLGPKDFLTLLNDIDKQL